MTKVITSEDCGNSPKNLFAQAFTIALMRGNKTFILSSVADDIRWEIMSRDQKVGRDGLVAQLKEAVKEKPVELIIHHIVTHGKAGAVNGTLKLKSGRVIAFCHVYEFTNAKGESIQKITSYEIQPR